MDNLNTPLNPQAPRAQTTPIPGQPLQSQGMPTGQNPSVMPGQEFASPEERQKLIELLDATKEKMAGLRTAEFSGGNAFDNARQEALRELFSMMQSAGVDLTSTESVNMFLEKIKAANPNLAQDFEEAIDTLLGPDPEVMAPGQPQNNETISEDLRGPSTGQNSLAQF